LLSLKDDLVRKGLELVFSAVRARERLPFTLVMHIFLVGDEPTQNG